MFFIFSLRSLFYILENFFIPFYIFNIIYKFCRIYSNKLNLLYCLNILFHNFIIVSYVKNSSDLFFEKIYFWKNRWMSASMISERHVLIFGLIQLSVLSLKYPRIKRMLWTEAIHEGCHGIFPMYRPIMLHEPLTLLARRVWRAAHTAHASSMASRSHCSRVEYGEQKSLFYISMHNMFILEYRAQYQFTIQLSDSKIVLLRITFTIFVSYLLFCDKSL